jgi:regulator of sirC expression with transglutaminase-like and TPR domain
VKAKSELLSESCDELRSLVARPDASIDLARAALAIARIDHANLSPDRYLSRIDQLGAAVARRLGSESNPYRSIAATNYVLFHEQGFCGNREDYFDPKNSFLNQVIERKKGIPITLSVLYMLVAQKIGLTIHGVGFPGHFMVKYSDDQEEIVIDPFNGGDIRSVGDLRELLRAVHGAETILRPRLLVPATKKQILERMLRNLKMIYLRERQFFKAISVLDRLLIVHPTSADDLRDRALVYLQLECFTQALADFQSYLRMAPDAPDAETVRHHIVTLSKQVNQIH